MPDHYFIYAGDGMANTSADKHMVRCVDGRVLFHGRRLETALAQEICDELNTCRDASTAR